MRQQTATQFKVIVGESALRLKSFPSARATLQGIELMHMIKKGRMVSGGSHDLSAAEQFYSLAALKSLRG